MGFRELGNINERIIDTVTSMGAEPFDRPRMAQVIKLVGQGLSPREIWDKMLESFMGDQEGTLYYISYTNTLLLPFYLMRYNESTAFVMAHKRVCVILPAINHI